MTIEELENIPLRECPLCGGVAEYSKGLRTNEVWGIRCKKCGCNIRMDQHGVIPWNTRVSD